MSQLTWHDTPYWSGQGSVHHQAGCKPSGSTHSKNQCQHQRLSPCAPNHLNECSEQCPSDLSFGVWFSTAHPWLDVPFPAKSHNNLAFVTTLWRTMFQALAASGWRSFEKTNITLNIQLMQERTLVWKTKTMKYTQVHPIKEQLYDSKFFYLKILRRFTPTVSCIIRIRENPVKHNNWIHWHTQLLCLAGFTVILTKDFYLFHITTSNFHSKICSPVNCNAIQVQLLKGNCSRTEPRIGPTQTQKMCPSSMLVSMYQTRTQCHSSSMLAPTYHIRIWCAKHKDHNWTFHSK